MLKLTFRNLWARKARLVTSSFAVILGVAFLVGTLVLTATLGKVFDDLFADAYRGTDAVVRVKSSFKSDGPFSTRDRVPASLVAKVAAVPGVATAEGGVDGQAQLIKPNGKVLQVNAPTFGYNWRASPKLNPFRLTGGRVAKADDEIVVDAGMFKRAKLKLGDRVKVVTQRPTESFTVVGRASFGSSDGQAGATSIFFTTPTAQRLLGEPGYYSQIGVVAAPGIAQEAIANRITKALHDGRLETVTGKALTNELQKILKNALKFFNYILVGFAAVALIAGTFVIYNSFSILVAQRTREMALLRAVGALGSQVRASLLLESAVIGLLASVIGAGLGVLLAIGLKALFGVLGFDLPSAGVTVRPSAVVVGVIVGFGVTVISAVAPAIRASRIAPLAALRDVAIDRSGTSRSRFFAGMLSLGVVAACIAGGVIKGKGTGAALIGIGFLAGIVAAAVLGPLAAKVLGGPMGGRVVGALVVGIGGLAGLGALGSFVAGITKNPVAAIIGAALLGVLARGLIKAGMAAFSIVGGLARQNAVRNPKRTAGTAMALTVGVGVVTMILTLSSSLTGTFTGAINKQVKAEYLISSGRNRGFSPTVIEEIRKLPGVAGVSPWSQSQARIAGAGGDKSPVAIDPATLPSVVDLGPTDGRIADLSEPDTIAIARKSANQNHWKVGSILAAELPKGKTKLRVVAIYKNTDGLNSAYYLVSEGFAKKWFTSSLVTFGYVKLAPGADRKTVEAGANKALIAYPNAELKTKKQYIKEVLGNIAQLLALIGVMLFLSILISVLGIANTLALSIFERKREIGLLRAIGTTRDQTKGIVRWESMIVSLLGTLAGLILGLVFGIAFVKAIGKSAGIKLTLPVQAIGVIGLAVVVGLVASLLPARRAARTNVLEALTAQ